jgi:hypothetical protein
MTKLGVVASSLHTASAPEYPLPLAIFGDNQLTLEKLGPIIDTNIYATIDAMIEFELTHHTTP